MSASPDQLKLQAMHRRAQLAEAKIVELERRLQMGAQDRAFWARSSKEAMALVYTLKARIECLEAREQTATQTGTDDENICGLNIDPYGKLRP